MRRLFLVATLAALAWARPETYRETEDFKFARSSTDEGTKSGYYAAQHGNMAGNYERAHNMDSLAQHQMSGAINHVQGELGDASKNPAGSVYTAALSSGTYGSGHHDYRNLAGRNFGESSSSDSHSSMAALNQQSQNADWRSQSHGYGASSQLGQLSHAGSLQAADAGYGSNYGSNSHSTGYHSASGYQSQTGYNSQNGYDQAAYQVVAPPTSRYTIVPVRIVGRPGTQVAIPVYGEAGYDAHRAISSYGQSSSNRQAYSQKAASSFDQNAIHSEAEVLNNNQQHASSVPVAVGSTGTQVAVPVYGEAGYDAHRAISSYGQSSSNRQAYSQTAASSFDQNAINSEAEVLNNNQQHGSSVPVAAGSTGKGYSSSYNYRKSWERHSGDADSAATVNPIPNHSELNEDAQSTSGSDQQSNSYNSGSRHNSYSQLGSSQSGHQSDYRTQQSSHANSHANSKAYMQGTYGNAGLAPLVDSQPKSYQSSYSYHKSWEKQGDPYVIKPATYGDASQRLVSGDTKNSASSHQRYAQGGVVDCDSLCRYRRSTRSVRTQDYYQQTQEDLGQQAQTGWGGLGQTQQQYKPEELEDLGQQTQQSWDNLQQQRQSEQQLEDLGQQTQQSWGNLQQHGRPQKLEDLGQQTRQSWGNLQQENRPQKLKDLGQQAQQSWDNSHHQRQSQILEGLGQQSGGNLNHQRPQKLEDLGEQTQQSSGNLQQQNRPQELEDLGQQTRGNLQQQQQPQKVDDLGQQTQGKLTHLDQEFESNLDDLGQQTQQTWDQSNIQQQSGSQNLENLGQQTQGQWDMIEKHNEQSQQSFGKLDNLGQQSQSTWDNLEGLGKQTQHTWDSSGKIDQQNQPEQIEEIGQKKHNQWDDFDKLGQQTQTQWDNINTINKTRHTDTSNTEQQTQTHFGNLDEVKPNKDHVGDNQFTLNKENPDANNPDNPVFWGHHTEQKHENNIHDNQHSYNNFNSNSYLQNHGASWGHYNNINAKPAHNNPLQSIWDKLDNMEEQSEHSSNENEQQTEYENSHHSYGQESSYRHVGNWETKNNSYKHQETHYSGNNPPIVFNSTVDKPKNDQTLKEVIPQKSKEDDDEESEELEPVEPGRGDIGAEGDSKTTTKPVTNPHTYTTQIKPEKTPAELEALSLSRGTEDSDESLGVLSITEQKRLDEQQRASNELHKVRASTTIRSPQSETNKNTIVDGHNQESKNRLEHSLEQPKEIQQLDQVQKSETEINQQIQNTFHNYHDQNVDQRNTGQQLEDIWHPTQNLNQQSQQQFANLGQQSFDQQKNGQQLEDFGQQTQDLSQHSQNFDQQNTGQQVEDFGQQTQDLQQNLQQFNNLGDSQQKQGQQLEDFDQQTQDLNQQSLRQFANSGQHSQSYDQQNTGQQLEDVGQQTQDLSQQNLQEFAHSGQRGRSFGQHSSDQQSEAFSHQTQHSEFHQQNLEQHTASSYHHEAREFMPKPNSQPAEELIITPVSDHGSEKNTKQDVEIVPPVVTTEKPGFWRSVGSKLSNAKDSVASWFRS